MMSRKDEQALRDRAYSTGFHDGSINWIHEEVGYEYMSLVSQNYTRGSAIRASQLTNFSKDSYRQVPDFALDHAMDHALAELDKEDVNLPHGYDFLPKADDTNWQDWVIGRAGDGSYIATRLYITEEPDAVVMMLACTFTVDRENSGNYPRVRFNAFSIST